VCIDSRLVGHIAKDAGIARRGERRWVERFDLAANRLLNGSSRPHRC
jgi:hypothetical protein